MKVTRANEKDANKRGEKKRREKNEVPIFSLKRGKGLSVCERKTLSKHISSCM